MLKTISSDITVLSDSVETMEWQVRAEQEVCYNVALQLGLFEVNNPRLAQYFGSTGRVMAFVDQNIHRLYGEKIKNYFASHGITLHLHLLTAGEVNKNIQLLQKVIDEIIIFSPYRRYEPLLVIGGGVLSDIVAFAAAIYKRGIPIIRVPTTLMGMIDAAIGVKCGINYATKNLLGAYYACQNTFIDPMFLWTLPETHICNGIAEIIKIALVCSESLFNLCYDCSDVFFAQDNQYNNQVNQIIVLAIELMLHELSGNLYEYNLQRAVDFGHTWSPTIELAEHKLLHGFAVNVDMAFSICIARVVDLINDDELEKIFALMRRVNLPVSHPLIHNKQFIMQVITDISKHRGGSLNLPLPHQIGRCTFLNMLTRECIDDACQLHLSLIKDYQYETA